jgi:hypothetical protein
MNGNRIWTAPLGGLALALLLTACGGNGDVVNADGGGTGGTSGGTSGGSSVSGATCTGASRAATTYDVFLNTADGIAQETASRNVQLYGQTTDAGQCISVAGSTAQADSSPGTVQVATTDDWNNAITYVDPVGTSVNGGVKFNQGLFVTCTGGSDTFSHVGVSNPGNASTFVSSNQVAAAIKDTPLVNYECVQSGSTSSPADNSTSTVTFSSADGSVTIADGTNGTTTIAAADVPSLFTQAGYTLSGKVLRWYLYQLPVGSGTKQLLVHTSQRTDGTYNIDLFLAQ